MVQLSDYDVRWPNFFSKMIGDKVFGLLVAHQVGLPVPFTIVVNRRVSPFAFGRATETGETWMRTAPLEQVPGKFTTTSGWVDPFKLILAEDPENNTIMSVLSQHGIKQCFSGALIVGSDHKVIIEGKRGGGEKFMLGEAAPEDLPSKVREDVQSLYERALTLLGFVRFEWVHDGIQAWIVQMHTGSTDTHGQYITSKHANKWQTFNVGAGLEELRKAVAKLPEDTGILLSGQVGLTSHIADVLRRANVAARMEN
jgi:hypothetical protein